MINKNRTIAVLIVVILQMIFFTGWYAKESDVFKAPVKTIMVKTQSYDPRDLLSGQYIRLNYSFSRASGSWDRELKKSVYPEWLEGISNYSRETRNKKEVWIVLHEIDGFYEPKSSSFEMPEALLEGEVVIRGKRDRGSIKYGIERYFVPEGTKEPNREDAAVELNIYDGGLTRISKVYVNEKEWP